MRNVERSAVQVHTRLLHGELGQGDARIGRGQRGASKDLVHLLLREACEFLLRGLDASDQCVQIFLARDWLGCWPMSGNKRLEICHTLPFIHC